MAIEASDLEGAAILDALPAALRADVLFAIGEAVDELLEEGAARSAEAERAHALSEIADGIWDHHVVPGLGEALEQAGEADLAALNAEARGVYFRQVRRLFRAAGARSDWVEALKP